MTTYKIGTRGSLLAVTQSTLIKNELERISGKKFELVLIKTQGDEITNKPLWQLEGKDFFTKELDEALLNNQVDFVIHSYKDLGSVRPEGIRLAAVTERRFAQDILLITQETIQKLKNWEGDFVVGTSSPRRISNLSLNLKSYLPYICSTNKSIKCETLRGNVNTRIKKLKDGNYHAITLALAGIERLAHGEKSFLELTELLKGLNYFILPQSVFPSAASQGALGIEMNGNRNDQGELAALLSKLNHPSTVEEVQRERQAFNSYGGGCHLAVGIHVKKIENYFLHVYSGEVNGKRIEVKKIEGQNLEKIESGKKLFIGLPKGEKPGAVYDQLIHKKIDSKKINLDHKHIFVTSRYCLPTLKESLSSSFESIWAAGTKTAQEIAKEGIWVNGTSDSLGTADLVAFKNSKVLKMMGPNIDNNWATLSHYDATTDLGDIVGCYSRIENQVSNEFKMELMEVGACYWTSFPQYQIYTNKYPFLKDTKHFCGLGKTWQEFKLHNLKINVVASMQEFYELQ